MAVKFNGLCDAFVIVRGQDKQAHRTAYVERSNDPKWEETFEIDVTELELQVQVFDMNRFSKPTPLGEITILLPDLKPPFPEVGIPYVHSFPLSKVTSGHVDIEFTPINFGTVYESLPVDEREALAKFEDKELEKLYRNFQKAVGPKKLFVNGSELVSFVHSLGLLGDIVFHAPCSLAFGLGSVGSSLFADKGEFVPPRSLLIGKLTEHPEVLHLMGEQLMKAFDRKKSHRVEFSGVIKGLSALLHGTPREKAKLYFRTADRKGDEILDLEEVEATVNDHIQLFSIALKLLVKYTTHTLKTVGLAKAWDKHKLDQMLEIIGAVPRQWKFAQYKTEVCELIFRHLDKTGSGHITKKDYLRWFSNPEARQKYNAELTKKLTPTVGKLQNKSAKKMERVIKHNE